MRIAIVGAGLFGCTAAIHAARAGHEVHVIEIGPDIFYGVSATNQMRLHLGYHYPRSPETALECQAAMPSFLEEYRQVCIPADRQYYAIASHGSRTNPGDYVRFCKTVNLPCEPVSVPVPELNHDELDLVIPVDEMRVDPIAMKLLLRLRMSDLGIRVHLNSPGEPLLASMFDKIVVAAYARNPVILRGFGIEPEPMQFEIVEKPVIDLQGELKGFGCVILDGPFCSLDPLGSTTWHVLGHVDHAIIHRNVGIVPDIPPWVFPYTNRGFIHRPNIAVSVAERMGEAAVRYIPALNNAGHVGSYFMTRAVLPDRDHDDARPTIVTQPAENIINIFSGKMATAVEAARQVCSLL